MDYDRTQIARMTRMHADTKSVRLIFICEISFTRDAMYIYHLFHIYILALNIPPNSYTVSRFDPALIEVPAFVHVRVLRGDGRGLACACEDQLGGWGLIKESWRDFRQRRGSLTNIHHRKRCETEDEHRWTTIEHRLRG